MKINKILLVILIFSLPVWAQTNLPIDNNPNLKNPLPIDQALKVEQALKTKVELPSNILPDNKLELINRVTDFIPSIQKSDEGGWSGNGGGNNNSADNIWFIGHHKVNYCIVKSADYPLNAKDLILLIEDSVQMWLKFFENYSLLDKKLAGGFHSQAMNKVQFIDGMNRSMTRNFQYTNDCSAAQLQFLFGVQNNVTQHYKKYFGDHPYGMAIRQKYDHQTYSHKGMVWIDQFTSEPLEIKHVLLHELGHVFGMEHDSVPVMDQSLVQLMGKRSGKFVSDFVGKIETDAWTFGVKKRQPLVLTSSKGLKLRKNTNSHMSGPMQASSHQCGDLTFSKNSTIPRNILRGLNLSSTDCHRITLTYLDEKPYPRGNRSRHLFQLKIEEQTSRKTLVLEGLFNTSEGVKPKTSGPAVVTETARLNRSNKIVKMTKKLTLKKTQDIFPLTGKFRHSRDDFATKISFNKGLVLEIFIPSVNAWWTFKTHYNQF